MISRYYKWIWLGFFFVAISIISFWGKWGAIVVLLIFFFVYTRCPITWWYIYGKKPKKEVKNNEAEKTPKKIKYLDWEYENGKPVAKSVKEKDLKES
jgi:hypothetical protein